MVTTVMHDNDYTPHPLLEQENKRFNSTYIIEDSGVRNQGLFM